MTPKPADNIVSESICAGESTVFGGVTYSEPGTYRISNDGCSSDDVLVLEIFSVIPDEISIMSICDEDLPYNWNGRILTSEGVYTNPSTDSNGCPNQEILDLKVLMSEPDIVENVEVCAGDLPFTWNGEEYSTAGSYSILNNDASGCDSYLVLELNILDRPEDIVVDVTLCDDEFPYVWNGEIFTEAGNYSRPLSTTEGCDYTAILNIVGYEATDNSRTEISTCIADLPFFWEGSNYNEFGEFEIEKTDSNGCIYNAVLVLTETNCGTAIFGDRIWSDEDGDGVQDASEKGIPDAKVRLYYNGVLVDSVTTKADGNYLFEELVAGDYHIDVQLLHVYYTRYIPTFYQTSNTDNDSDIYELDADDRIYNSVSYSLADGEDYREVDGGFYASNGIGNQVWIDNRTFGRIDGFDASDEQIADVQVDLYDATTDQIIATDFTDPFGRYLFQRLPKGIYYVGFVAPVDYVFVMSNALGDDDKEDSDAVVTDLSDVRRGFSQAVSLNVDEFNFTIDAGLVRVDDDDEETGPLAVENLSFSGKHDEENHVNQLWWSTDSEVNSDKFIVERSIGSTTNFEEIGRVEGAGNSSEYLEYAFEDNRIESGIHYYRINAVDLDGTSDYSSIITINVASEFTKNKMLVYPNPATDFVNIDITNSRHSIIEGGLYDVLGNKLIEIKDESKDAYSQLVIDLGVLPAGKYIVNIQLGTEVFVTRLIKLKSE